MALLTHARHYTGLLLAGAALAWACMAAAAPDMQVERQIKAAYLYKFASYVEWPERSFAYPNAPLVIGIAGNDALAAELAAVVRERRIGGHPLAVRRLQPGESPAGLHVLFAGGSGDDVAGALAAARGRPVLTVTDAEASPHAGMINFLVADKRLRFEVALWQASTAHLRISARMLAAALRVRTEAS